MQGAEGKEAPPSPPAKPSPPAPIAEGVQQCDLCQENVGIDMDAHYRSSHGALVAYCNSYIDRCAAIRARTVSPHNAHELGKYAHEQLLLTRKDGGEGAFQKVIDAQRQMAAILRSVYPDDTLYFFGSTLAYGSWDGSADIDMTLLSPTQCVDTNPQSLDHDAEVAKVMRVTVALRTVGFLYDDLEPLRYTRVPIVKHKCSHRSVRRLDMRARQLHVMYSKSLPPQDYKKIEEALHNRGISTRLSGNGRTLFLTCNTETEAMELRANPASIPTPGCGAAVTRTLWENAAVKPIAYCIDFDVSFRAFGIRNSWLLRHYMSQSHEVRCGSAIVKMWSKCSGINNSKKGYFTTYAVNILWIYYLLQQKKVAFANPTAITAAVWKQQPSYVALLPPQTSESTFRQLGDLLLGFFRFYAFEFSWKEDVISITRPSVTTKASMQWVAANERETGPFRDRVWYRVSVEDPYEENLNLGRHVSPVKFHKVLAEFIAAFDKLSRGLASDLFVDSSCERSAEECRRVAMRSMLCIDNLPLQKVVADVRESHHAALAAYEMQNTTRALFVNECKYVVRTVDGELVVHNPNADHEESIAAIVQQVDNATSLDAELGTKVCDYSRLTLLQRILFLHEDSFRLFSTRQARDRLAAHYTAAMRALSSSRVLPLADVVLKSAAGLEEGFLRRVIEAESMGVVDGDGNITSSRFGYMRATAGGMSGRCGECHRVNVQVFPAAEHSVDRGFYCATCWDRYENAHNK